MGGEARGVANCSSCRLENEAEPEPGLLAIPPLTARIHLVTGDEAKEGTSWQRFEKNLSVPLHARGSVLHFQCGSRRLFLGWRLRDRTDVVHFFEGWHNSGSCVAPPRRVPGASRARLLMARSDWSTPELYVRPKAMWSAARSCLAHAGTGGNHMLRRGMAGIDVQMSERCTLFLHTQVSALLSNFIFVTRAYLFFGRVGRQTVRRQSHPSIARRHEYVLPTGSSAPSRWRLCALRKVRPTVASN